MTSCRYCRYANGTWVRSLERTTYACRLGKDTRKVKCSGFEREPGSDDDREIENIYEGSIMDTFN